MGPVFTEALYGELGGVDAQPNESAGYLHGSIQRKLPVGGITDAMNRPVIRVSLDFNNEVGAFTDKGGHFFQGGLGRGDELGLSGVEDDSFRKGQNHEICNALDVDVMLISFAIQSGNEVLLDGSGRISNL